MKLSPKDSAGAMSYGQKYTELITKAERGVNLYSALCEMQAHLMASNFDGVEDPAIICT